VQWLKVKKRGGNMRSNAGPKNNNQAFKFTIREENSSYPAGQEEPLKKVV
jgi:hypothetical protein